MALFHLNVTQVKRSAGQSAVACAAYRAGEKLYSRYYGEYSDYTRKGGVVCSEILLPPQAPPEYQDRQTLWNAVEEVERHPQAQLAYSFDIALQNEFSMEENIALARQFLLEHFVSRGMAVDYAVHQPDRADGGIPNPHFHVMCLIRPIKENGRWGAKQRREYVLDENGNRIKDGAGHDKFNAVPTTDWGSPETLEEWRKAWAGLCNAKFAEKGLPCRIDHRSYARQGVEQLPTVHEGPAVRQMEARGVQTDKGAFNRFVKATNTMMKTTRATIQKLLHWLKEIKAGLSKPQEPTLADFLNRYYAGRNAGAWSQRARLGNLKSHSEAVNFLLENGIFTLADLEEKVQSCGEQDGRMKAAMKQKQGRIKKLDDLLQLADFYRQGKPVYDKLNSIKFQKAREKFAAENEHTLHFFYLARRKLEPHFSKDGELPVKAWEAERAKLKTEYAALNEQYRPFADEVKKLWQVRYAVERARYEMEREQGPAHKHEQER